MGCEVVGGVGGYRWFLATPFGLLTAPLLTELNTNHLTGKRTPAAATKLQKTIYFNSISNKSRLELNVRQNGTIHEIQETHHVFFKKKKNTFSSKKKKKKKKNLFIVKKKKKKKKKK